MLLAAFCLRLVQKIKTNWFAIFHIHHYRRPIHLRAAICVVSLATDSLAVVYVDHEIIIYWTNRNVEWAATMNNAISWCNLAAKISRKDGDEEKASDEEKGEPKSRKNDYVRNQAEMMLINLNHLANAGEHALEPNKRIPKREWLIS